MVQHFVSDGAQLNFYDAGAGRPVVFLHPTPLSHAYWLPVIERLQNHRTIALDLRGHGASELEGAFPDQALPIGGFVPGVADLTLGRMALDVLSLLDHLHIEKADFVGCSVGGYLLLELWRRAPVRMNKLGFVCSKAQGDTAEGREKRKQTLQKIDEEGVEVVLDSLVNSLTGATSQAMNPMLCSELRAMATLTAKTEKAIQAGLALRPDSLQTLSTIDRPILAIAGEEDSVCTAAEMQVFEQAPGGCEFHLLPQTGHFSAFEQPEQVSNLIQGWLNL
jgi:pimeloyl-ACP methyl ester carboxylesterase